MLRQFWNKVVPVTENELEKKLHALGIKLDTNTGQLFYHDHFQPIQLNFELVFVRHGETYGNCGQSSMAGKIDLELVNNKLKDKDKRIYQGNVDTEINQLTEYGRQQAQDLALKLKTKLIENGWVPDVVLISPLSRAIQTAMPFMQQNNFLTHYYVHQGIREMSFGSWENRRICDLPSDDTCHQFYLEQDALVKKSGIDCDGRQREAENFAEVLIRAHQVLQDLNNKYGGKKILMFSHSMFGAACCLLLGHGQKIENGHHLAFDGKRSDGTYYTIPHAEPFFLNDKLPKRCKPLFPS